MQKTHIRDFTSGKITKQLLIFASPLFLSSLLQIVYNMVDMIVVGHHLGKTGISAVSVGGDVTNFLTFIAIGFSSAGQVLIAKIIGSKQTQRLGKFVGAMTGFLLFCALVLSVVSLIFQEQILRLMNTPDTAWEGALSYSGICMMGMVFIYGYNVVSAIMRGMGDSKHPFIFISIAAVLNLVLDIILVPRLDEAGAALATVISQGLSFILCFIFLMTHKGEFKLQLKPLDFIKWDKRSLADLLKLGTPMAIKSAAIHLSKLFVNSWINSYGVAVSAFAGVAAKIASIATLFSNSFNTASATMVGQNIAAEKYGRVKKIMLSVGLITFIISSVMAVCIALFPDAIFGIFTDEADVLEIGRVYVPIAILMFYGSTARAIMYGLINGSGNTRINFVTAILDGIVLRIGLALLFGLALNMKHFGFWLGDALAGFTPFFVGLAFYLSGKWKKQNI